MGIKKWLGGLISGKEKPVYATPTERNRKIREYQLFLGDYGRIYGSEMVSNEFVASENAPSYRLWLLGRDQGVKDAYQSLPPELKEKFHPQFSSEPKEIAPLPQIYQALKANKIKPEVAAEALGFDSLPGFAQIMTAIDELVNENIQLKQKIVLDQNEKESQAAAEPIKAKRKRGPNKPKAVETETQVKEGEEKAGLLNHEQTP